MNPVSDSAHIYSDRRILLDEEDGIGSGSAVSGKFEISSHQPLRKALIIVTTSAGLVALIGVTIFVVVNQPKQFRCFSNTTVGAICRGPSDSQSCKDAELCMPDICGTKLSPGLDISVAGSAQGVPVPVDWRSVPMIFWSLVPYLLAVLVVGFALYDMTDSAWSPVFLMIILTIVNEGILKNAIHQDRPEGSCLFKISYGMPSGHASLSIGMLSYFLLETFIDRPAWSVKEKFLIAVNVLFFLAPVPYSRVYLQDHFASQVVAGAGEGFLLAAPWFIFMYFFAQPRLSKLCGSPISRYLAIKHNYRIRGSENKTADARSRNENSYVEAV